MCQNKLEDKGGLSISLSFSFQCLPHPLFDPGRLVSLVASVMYNFLIFFYKRGKGRLVLLSGSIYRQ